MLVGRVGSLDRHHSAFPLAGALRISAVVNYCNAGCHRRVHHSLLSVKGMSLEV
jgi:hypothetical protein